jgi:cellobiose-specific phosphotransferase system component IIB
VAQAVECLPGKLKALSSNPTTAMTKKERKKIFSKEIMQVQIIQDMTYANLKGHRNSHSDKNLI